MIHTKNHKMLRTDSVPSLKNFGVVSPLTFMIPPPPSLHQTGWNAIFVILNLLWLGNQFKVGKKNVFNINRLASIFLKLWLNVFAEYYCNTGWKSWNCHYRWGFLYTHIHWRPTVWNKETSYLVIQSRFQVVIIRFWNDWWP